MNILISGGSGQIGQRLVEYLNPSDRSVRLLSRSSNGSSHLPVYQWDIPRQTMDAKALEDVDAVIHLAGANVAEGRWTEKRKKELWDSRIQSTRLLYQTLQGRSKRPHTIICASATGYYGLRPFEHVSDEEDEIGTDFLAELCGQWESEADQFKNLGIRVIKVRTGIVLDHKGGALQKMSQPIRLGIGAALGTGQQYIPWIHWEDWCGIIKHFLEKEQCRGTYNLVAPHPVTNEVLTRLIAHTLNRPLWLPKVPALVLKALLGSMSAVVLSGHKVTCQKVISSGYQFKYESADQAIRDLFSQH